MKRNGSCVCLCERGVTEHRTTSNLDTGETEKGVLPIRKVRQRKVSCMQVEKGVQLIRKGYCMHFDK